MSRFDKKCKICGKITSPTIPSTKGGYICVSCVTGYGFPAGDNWVTEDKESIKYIKAQKKKTSKFKVGDYVTVIPNAKGTVWESGIIMDINPEGAIIGYGSKNCPRWARLYGLHGREPLYNLKKRKGD